MSKWTSYDGGAAFLIPDLPGVYAVYCDDQLIYIGQAANVRKRIASHGIDLERYSCGYTTPWGHFDRCVIKVRSSDRYGDWAMHELRLIRRLRPRENCLHGPRKRKGKEVPSDGR
jgi:hypothetical protein